MKSKSRKPKEVPPEVRRRAAVTKGEAQRAVVAEAWCAFHGTAAQGEVRARRTIAWTRRLAGLAAVIGVVRTLGSILRRPARGRPELMRKTGFVARMIATVATLRKLGRLLRLAAG